MKKSLKKIVFELMEKGQCNDQRIVDEMGGESKVNWQTVEIYKYAFKKEKITNKLT